MEELREKSVPLFTINQTGTSSVAGKSPADLWFGRRVSLHSMKSFGCECYMMIPDHQRQKMNEKSKKGIFVGYDIEEQGYRIYFPDKRQVEVSCNVLFNEKIGPEKGYIEIDKNWQKITSLRLVARARLKRNQAMVENFWRSQIEAVKAMMNSQNLVKKQLEACQGMVYEIVRTLSHIQSIMNMSRLAEFKIYLSKMP